MVNPTDKPNNEIVGKILKITIDQSGHPWHYVGEIKRKDDTHILIDDGKEGETYIPLTNALIRTPTDSEIQKYYEFLKERKNKVGDDDE